MRPAQRKISRNPINPIFFASQNPIPHITQKSDILPPLRRMAAIALHIVKKTIFDWGSSSYGWGAEAWEYSNSTQYAAIYIDNDALVMKDRGYSNGNSSWC